MQCLSPTKGLTTTYSDVKMDLSKRAGLVVAGGHQVVLFKCCERILFSSN